MKTAIVGETVIFGGGFNYPVSGGGVADVEIYDFDFGERYCSPAVSNSSGSPTELRIVGSTSVSRNELTLRARSLPPGSFGFFLTSLQPGLVNQPSGSQGVLCLCNPIGRYVGPGQILNSGTAGTFELMVDLSQHPTPTGLVHVAPGETWNFQCWHRDQVGGTATSNLSDAVSLTFQ
jgi:hypothetical protein